MKIQELKEGFFDDLLKKAADKIGLNEPDASYSLPNDLVQKFEHLGGSINKAIFTPGSDLHRALRVDERFKDNIENLVVKLVQDAQKKLAYANDQEMKNAIDRGVDLLPEQNLQAAFLGHLNLSDPSLPPNFRGTVTKFIKDQKANFDSLMSLFQQMVQDERTRGKQPSAGAAFAQLKSWAQDALHLIDNIKPEPQQKQAKKQKQQQAGKTQATQTTQTTQATQAGAGQFSEPLTIGGQSFVKGPNGWVSTKDQRTPAPDNMIAMLDQALAQDQALRAAGARAQ